MLNTPKVTKRGRTTLAAAAAMSLGVAGVVLTGGAASAAPVAGPVDDSVIGSLTIHKYAYPADGAQDPSGSGQDPTSDVIEGVDFEVCAIDNITSLGDTSNLGWDQVLGLDALSSNGAALTGSVAGVDGGSSFDLLNCQTVTTDVNGEAFLANLAVGAYLVTETAAPAGVIMGDPFVVTVPTPADDVAGADNTGMWEYDVNVYPKNVNVEAPDKVIGDQPTNGVVLGDDIDYTISQRIPALADGDVYTKLTVTDTLDDKLDLLAGSVVVGLDGTALTEGTDYSLDTTGDVITVVFLQPGLDQLANGQTLTVDFTAVANANGVIDNQAFVNVNDLDLDGDGNGGDNPTPVVTTRWGNLLGEKTDATGSNVLGGAEFNVYMTSDTDGTCDDAATADIDGLTPVATTTSAADGSIVVSGLWVGDTNEDVADRCYILEETVAPAGYVLPTGDAALTSVNIVPGDTAVAPTFTIENDQQLVPGLPLTGSDGQMLLTIGGIALLTMAAGGVLLARTRREHSEVTEAA
ncbi:SpaH/EbpB family LPXTG-anchored major pilin [Microbacterium paraoxydans]|uniref:SpaH/EbpB family LPXTG-anchored major pilin n=1 Tax=Microbacterium paraoxydans TaxID=199592 RepID=UPI001CF9A529|nr:SpaH/EbpB family LPXTG-anchored major pilin [Microbacterium paraoxydans]